MNHKYLIIKKLFINIQKMQIQRKIRTVRVSTLKDTQSCLLFHLYSQENTIPFQKNLIRRKGSNAFDITLRFQEKHLK